MYLIIRLYYFCLIDVKLLILIKNKDIKLCLLLELQEEQGLGKPLL